MDIMEIREFCMGLPEVTEDQAFGEDWVLFRVRNKIFAALDFNRPELVVVKCDADYAVDLRDRFLDIVEPAWHWNKKYWNQIHTETLTEGLVRHFIVHSYNQVIEKMPKSLKTGLEPLSYGERME